MQTISIEFPDKREVQLPDVQEDVGSTESDHAHISLQGIQNNQQNAEKSNWQSRPQRNPARHDDSRRRK